MGCFLSCFWIKDDGKRNCRIFSRCISWKKRELVVPRNQYASVASFEEKENLSEKGQWESFQGSFDEDYNVHREQRQEAKFLKTCGASVESSVKIRKASYKHSIISDACFKGSTGINRLTGIFTFFQSSQNEEHENKSGMNIMLSEKSKHSGNENLWHSATLDLSPSVENQMQPCSHESPYPTPLNLVDGMQTPGTVYPSKLENIRTGKIRTQFVYPVPDLSQRPFELKVECNGRGNTQMMTLASSSMEASWWLKHQDKFTMDDRKQISGSDNSLHVDRPIAGDIVAKWKEEHSHFSPKHWDGNGIPIFTTKYKEDQKVSWHATPFEVRLNKALSDEEYPQRQLKHQGSI